MASLVIVAGLAAAACGAKTPDSASGSSGSVRGAAPENAVAAAAPGCLKPGQVCLDQDLRGVDLAGLGVKDLRGAVLAGSRFDGANLAGVNLSGANLVGTSWGPLDCGVPMAAGCLLDYGWNTLGPPVSLHAAPPLGGPDAGPVGASGQPIAEVKFSGPLAVEISGDSRKIYVADTGNRVVRMIDVVGGTVSTLAGSGKPCAWGTDRCGDSPTATGTSVNFSRPAGLSLDSTGKTLFIADADMNSSLIWKLDLATGKITILAGTGRAGLPVDGDGKPARKAALAAPRGMAESGSVLYVADSGNNAIRAVDLDSGVIGTVAGSVTGEVCQWLASSGCGYSGKAAAALFNNPTDVAATGLAGRIVIADSGDSAIREIRGLNGAGYVNATITTIVSPSLGTPISAKGNFPIPTFVAADSSGDLFLGPVSTDGKSVGRVDAQAVNAGSTIAWDHVPQVVPGGMQASGGGAVAGIPRYVVTTKPGVNQVQVLPAVVGANISQADFTGANFSSDPYTGSITRLDRIYQDKATLTDLDLTNAAITNSVLPDLGKAAMQGIVLDKVTLGPLGGTDMVWATIGQLPGFKADNICLNNAKLNAQNYPEWQLSNSSVTGLLPAEKNGTVTFADPKFTTVNLANADPAGRWVFQGGQLDTVNFYPAPADKGQFTFNGTSLPNTPRNPHTSQEQSPDYTKSPANWNTAATITSCGPVTPGVQPVPDSSITITPPTFNSKSDGGGAGKISSTVQLQTDANSQLAGGSIRLKAKENVYSIKKFFPTEFSYLITEQPGGQVISEGNIELGRAPLSPTDHPYDKTVDLADQISRRRSALPPIRSGSTVKVTIIDRGTPRKDSWGVFEPRDTGPSHGLLSGEGELMFSWNQPKFEFGVITPRLAADYNGNPTDFHLDIDLPDSLSLTQKEKAREVAAKEISFRLSDAKTGRSLDKPFGAAWSPREIYLLFGTLQPGQQFTLTVLKNGEPLKDTATFTLQYGPLPGDKPAPIPVPLAPASPTPTPAPGS